MNAPGFKSWLGLSADGLTARVCAGCPDKAASEAFAKAHGVRVTHTSCPACAAAFIAEVDRLLPGPASIPFDAGTACGEHLLLTYPLLQPGKSDPGGACLEPAAAPLLARAGAVASAPLAAAARVDYVSADEVAEVCGVSEYALHNRHKPAHWGVPHDWKFNGRRVLYRFAALPELADELAGAGRQTEAERLRLWWLARVNPSLPPAMPAVTPPHSAENIPWYQKGQFE